MASSKKASTKSPAKCIYVVAGKDTALVKVRCQECVDTLIAPAQRPLALMAVDGDEAQIATVLDELRTAPFLADRRVVVVSDADGFVSKYREVLERYFDSPCPTGVLVLAVQTWAATTKLAKKLANVGELIACEPPKPWHMPAELSRYAADRHGKRMAQDAAETIVQGVGERWTALLAEVDKLALFVGQAPQITVEHVRQLTSGGRLFDAFEVIEAVTGGRKGEALETLRRLMTEDKDAQYTIVGAFAFHLRRLFQAKVLMAKGTRPDEIAKALRIWGKKDDLFAQVRRLSLGQISGSIQRLAEMDYALKTGQARPAVAVEQFVLGLI